MTKAALALALAAALAATASSAGLAKTASGSIKLNAQVVPGNTVSVYLINGANVITHVQDEATSTKAQNGAAPIISVSFDKEPSWTLVRLVTWDRTHRILTVNF